MELKALSCAIAQVINNYHAQKPNATLSSSEDSKTLEEKISEVGHRSNTSRLELLRYLYFGFTLSEKARLAKHTDNIQAIKPELVRFIHNLQRLITTTGIFSRSLSFSRTSKEKNLSVFLLDSSTSKARGLIQTLFTDIGLSPESDETSIQNNIELRFKNKEFKYEVALLEKQYNTLLMTRSNLTASSSSSSADSLDETGGDEKEGWQSVTYPPLLENTIPNNTLIERIRKLKNLIQQEQLSNPTVITTQPTEADDLINPPEAEFSLAGSPSSFFTDLFSSNKRTKVENKRHCDYP